MVTATVVIVQWYCVVLEFIVVTATVDILQFYFALCSEYCGYFISRYSAMVLYCVGVYCGYSNSRYSAMVLRCVWSLLWLHQQ